MQTVQVRGVMMLCDVMMPKMMGFEFRVAPGSLTCSSQFFPEVLLKVLLIHNPKSVLKDG